MGKLFVNLFAPGLSWKSCSSRRRDDHTPRLMICCVWAYLQFLFGVHSLTAISSHLTDSHPDLALSSRKMRACAFSKFSRNENWRATPWDFCDWWQLIHHIIFVNNFFRIRISIPFCSAPKMRWDQQQGYHKNQRWWLLEDWWGVRRRGWGQCIPGSVRFELQRYLRRCRQEFEVHVGRHVPCDQKENPAIGFRWRWWRRQTQKNQKREQKQPDAKPREGCWGTASFPPCFGYKLSLPISIPNLCLPGRRQKESAPKHEQGHQRVRAPIHMYLIVFEINCTFAMLRLRSLAKKARTVANELHDFPGNDVQGLADDHFGCKRFNLYFSKIWFFISQISMLSGDEATAGWEGQMAELSCCQALLLITCLFACDVNTSKKSNNKSDWLGWKRSMAMAKAWLKSGKSMQRNENMLRCGLIFTYWTLIQLSQPGSCACTPCCATRPWKMKSSLARHLWTAWSVVRSSSRNEGYPGFFNCSPVLQVQRPKAKDGESKESPGEGPGEGSPGRSRRNSRGFRWCDTRVSREWGWCNGGHFWSKLHIYMSSEPCDFEVANFLAKPWWIWTCPVPRSTGTRGTRKVGITVVRLRACASSRNAERSSVYTLGYLHIQKCMELGGSTPHVDTGSARWLVGMPEQKA